MTSDEIASERRARSRRHHALRDRSRRSHLQLGEDKPSHIVVPALHRNRMEIRQLFLDKMGLTELGTSPKT